MIATDFARDDCQLGKKRISYNKLTLSYRCNDCGGAVVMLPPSDDIGWHVACGLCRGVDLVHEYELARQRVAGYEVFDGLPENLQELLADESSAAGKDVKLQADTEKRDEALHAQHKRGSSVLFKT